MAAFGGARTYMKMKFFASSIVVLASFFLLCGCESIYIPNFFGDDEVPDEVKEQPRFVEIPMTEEEAKTWPRLGDVPSKPKDFSPKPVYEKSMDDLALERLAAEQARQRALLGKPNVATQNNPIYPLMQPPQFISK